MARIRGEVIMRCDSCKGEFIVPEARAHSTVYLILDYVMDKVLRMDLCPECSKKLARLLKKGLFVTLTKGSNNGKKRH